MKSNISECSMGHFERNCDRSCDCCISNSCEPQMDYVTTPLDVNLVICMRNTATRVRTFWHITLTLKQVHKYQLLKVNTWNQIFRVISMIILHCCCHWCFYYWPAKTCSKILKTCELYCFCCITYYVSPTSYCIRCVQLLDLNIFNWFFSNGERNRNILSDVF